MPAGISRPGGQAPTRSASAATTGSKSADIHRCNVLGVNTRDYTVDVRMEAHPFSNHFDIPFMVPYTHQAQGEGINFMPEVGSVCWVCSPSESGRDSFVMGWTTVHEDGTYRGGRELLNPGDLHLSTRDGNFVTVRRGGIVQIGATPVCQRIFIPIRNIIRDFAENYELATPAGELTWLVQRTDEQGDGHRACLMTIAAKEFSDDPNKDPIALLKIGSHGEGNETIISLQTRDKGAGTVKTNLEVFKNGSVKWKMEKDLTLDITGDYKTTVKGKMETTVTGDISLTSKAKLNGKASEVHLDGGGSKLDLAGAAKLNGTKVDLGDALFPALMNSPTFAAWANAITLLLNGPPSVPAFKGIVPPLTGHTSTKVKV